MRITTPKSLQLMCLVGASLATADAAFTLNSLSGTVSGFTGSDAVLNGITWQITETNPTGNAAASTVSAIGDFEFFQSDIPRIEFDISASALSGNSTLALVFSNSSDQIASRNIFGGSGDGEQTIEFAATAGSIFDLSGLEPVVGTSYAITGDGTDTVTFAENVGLATPVNSDEFGSFDVALAVDGSNQGSVLINPIFDADANGINIGGREAFSISIVPTTVPEPSSAALLGLGGLALFARRKRC